MSLTPTEHATRVTVAHHVRERLRSALRESGWSDARVAALLGLSETRVAAWWTERANAPLYLLAHPALPAGLVSRVVADVLRLRPDDTRGALDIATSTHALATTVQAFLAEMGRVFVTRTGDADTLRKCVTAVRDRADSWLRDHGGAR